MKTQLAIHEWLAILIIAFTFCLFGIIAVYDDEPPAAPIGAGRKMVKETILVTIRGAIELPGSYELPNGSSVADLLALAKPTALADLRKINPQSRLRNGRDLLVPECPMITIYLEGAVKNPGGIQVKKGTTLRDLNTLNLLLENADSLPLAKSRKLRDQEVVRISGIGQPPL